MDKGNYSRGLKFRFSGEQEDGVTLAVDIPADSMAEEAGLAWARFMLAAGYHPSSIREAAESIAEFCREQECAST